MAKAKQLSSGSWRVRVYVGRDINGKQIIKSITADTRKEAERLASQYEYNAMGELSLLIALEQFIESKTNILSPSTIRGYVSLKNNLSERYPILIATKVSKIDKDMLQALINDMAIKVSEKTIRNYVTLICSAIGKNFKLSYPSKKAIEYNFPSDDELRVLLNKAKDTELYIPILLGAFGMMRRSEICALTMEDINKCTIHISKAMVKDENKNWVIKQPKTYTSDRYVTVPQFVIDEINKKGYITNLQPDLISNYFKRLCQRNGMDYHFHCLRGYSASSRHAIGIPDSYIMEQGGWSNDVVLKRTYRHTLDTYQQEMINKTNEHFSKIVDTKVDTK